MPYKKPFNETVFKLLLPFLIMVLLVFGAIFFIFLPMAKELTKEHRKEALQDLSMTAWCVLSYYHNLEKENSCTLKFAQESAKETIRQLRYGKDNKQYYWIIDIRGHTLMHPSLPEYEGKNQLTLKDIDGKLFVQEFVNTAKNRGDGFVEYKWQLNDEPEQIKNKISHVRIFSPWGWIIRSGAHIEDDIDDDLKIFTFIIVMVVLLIIILVSVIYTFILRNFISSEKKKRSSFEKLLVQEEKIRALLEAIPDMILRIDREGVVLDYKEPIDLEPFIDPVDILDKKIIDSWDSTVAKEVIAAIERVFVTTEHQALVFDYPSDKKKIKIEAHFVMSDGNEILATFRDISTRL